MKRYVPAEWVKQDAVWVTWPCSDQWWKNSRAESLSAFANLTAAISRFEKVRVNCAADKTEFARKILRENGRCDFANVEFYPHETNDVWCRDSGAIFRVGGGVLDALDFKYNAWGEKFPPWDLDDALASKMASAAGVKSERVPLTCEGGALEFDGCGTLLTTDCVVLNKNRNPHIDRRAAEKIFAEYCGAEKTVWLSDGLFNDDTDGHIDNLARFAPEGKILAAVCEKSNPSYGQLSANLEILKNASDAEGKRFDVVELPVPSEPIFCKYYDGSERRLPASYANYLVVNGAVLVPTYNLGSDFAAMEIIGGCFGGREIVGVDSRVFLLEGGAVHCLTQQQPSI